MRRRVRTPMGQEVLRIPGGDTKRMQIPLGSPEEGTVAKVHVAPDPFLNEGDPIIDLA